MKVLSNFDTKLYERQIADATKKYGERFVLFVRRDNIYLVFKFYLPLSLIIILSCMALWGIISIDGIGFASSIIRGLLWISLALALVYFCRVSIGKFIDHYMDYMLITPEQITSFDQEGILKRSANTLDTSKIKSISIKQNGLLCSFFNYGSIIFYAEGDVSGQKIGQIQLNYIRSPRHVKKKIAQIISMGNTGRHQITTQQGTKNSLQSHRDRALTDVDQLHPQ